jgi:hypothetical protein
MAKKLERDLYVELTKASSAVISSYEAYLLDTIGWKDLAVTMVRLRKATRAVDLMDKINNVDEGAD